MIDFPPDYYINTTLEVGAVFKFPAKDLIDTDVPHYFIVVAIDEDDNYLVTCTSNKDGKINHFYYSNLDYSGLVYIKPSPENGLTDDTYVNCNDYHLIKKNVMIQKYKDGVLGRKGVVSYSHYDQIRRGIIESKINDIPDFLLVHPED